MRSACWLAEHRQRKTHTHTQTNTTNHCTRRSIVTEPYDDEETSTRRTRQEQENHAKNKNVTPKSSFGTPTVHHEYKQAPSHPITRTLKCSYVLTNTIVITRVRGAVVGVGSESQLALATTTGRKQQNDIAFGCTTVCVCVCVCVAACRMDTHMMTGQNCTRSSPLLSPISCSSLEKHRSFSASI